MKLNQSKEWYEQSAALEGDSEVGAGSLRRMVRAINLSLPKLPRAKRGKRFSLAIACLRMDMDYQRTNGDAMGRINIKDYEDAIATLEAVREKQPHCPNESSSPTAAKGNGGAERNDGKI